MNLYGSQRHKYCLLGMRLTRLWANCRENHLKVTIIHISNFFSLKKYTLRKREVWVGRGRYFVTEYRVEHLNPELDPKINFEITKLVWDQSDLYLCAVQICPWLPLPSPCDKTSLGTTACGPVWGWKPHHLHAGCSPGPGTKKQMLGEHLIPLIQTLHSWVAGKMRGMLLEMGNSQLRSVLYSPSLSAPRRMKLLCRLAKPRKKRWEGGCCCCCYL